MNDYNLTKLRELLQDFYYLTKIKICIYDSACNELCYYPEKLSPFCALLRESEDMERRCLECDKVGFSTCKKTYSQYVYTCHAGLFEAVSPIVYEQKIIGYIVIGQIRASEDIDWREIEARFPKEKCDRLKELYKRLPITEPQRSQAAMRILDACTGYEYLKGLMQNLPERIDYRITSFINEHIHEELTVARLCLEFHLSHSEIYHIFENYFATPPAEYIKARRLSKACELLKETDLPIGEIAGLVGVSDYNYFSKIFKRSFGVSPREYRKGQGK